MGDSSPHPINVEVRQGSHDGLEPDERVWLRLVVSLSAFCFLSSWNWLGSMDFNTYLPMVRGLEPNFAAGDSCLPCANSIYPSSLQTDVQDSRIDIFPEINTNNRSAHSILAPGANARSITEKGDSGIELDVVIIALY
ncbi:hypothetical protein CEP54_014158 [Fusarium duplospermum]|uniref:Uncharacterized protein n=1 Tax=Fusarium duplospermum TaxID=1325734 RepID=A0A428NY94_9HYPO|nr:hypothetical protein CEP54_014158 [Fusarium duplospermum]